MPDLTHASGAVLANVATSTTSATLIANTGRDGFIIHNDSAANLYVKFGTTAASPTSFTYKIAPGGTLEHPIGFVVWDGQVQGALDAGSGTARVTELV